jgi:hypothetical protein
LYQVEEITPMGKQVTEAEIQALHYRIWSENREALVEWPHNNEVEAGYHPYLVQEHCVRNEDWQRIRLSMKGIPTHEKLLVLKRWWDKKLAEVRGQTFSADNNPFYPTQIQVGNYLGALRRGGQLDDRNRIRKYI